MHFGNTHASSRHGCKLVQGPCPVHARHRERQKQGPLLHPRRGQQFLPYFCGDAANPNALNDTEAPRIPFYEAVALFVRTYAGLARNLAKEGNDDAGATALRKEIGQFVEAGATIKNHSCEEIDIKPHEADVRHLVNTVRKTIIRDQLSDPRFDEQMSKLLDDLIRQRRASGSATARRLSTFAPAAASRSGKR